VLTEAVELLRRFLPDGQWAACLCSLAEQEPRADDDAAAARRQQESMCMAAEVGFPLAIGAALVVAARLAERFGVNVSAIRLHAAADVVYEDAGFALMAADQALSDAMRSRVHARFGAERVGALTRDGRALDPHHAMELATRYSRRRSLTSASSRSIASGHHATLA
jgi:hypothetical protein